MLVSIRLRRISIILAVLGMMISGYLTWVHLTNGSALCVGGGGGCDAVQQSIYSDVAGIPVALIGLLGYAAILACLLLEKWNARFAQIAPHAVFGVSLVGVLYSAYLTYLELFVIRAICQYCVASAVLMLAVLGIAIYRLMSILSSEA